MKKYIEPFLHILFWILVLYITYTNFGVKVRMIKVGADLEYTKEYNPVFFALISVYIGLAMILFYGNLGLLLPKWIKSNNKKNATVAIAALFVTTLALSLLINYFIAKEYFAYEMHKGTALIAYSVFLHFLFLFLSIGYRLTKDWYKNEIIRKQILQEKLETELNFLKAQINPHFLFNTLNNLYAESRKHEDKKVANGIAKLSHMMRYMIYDSNVELVSLDKEINYLESYVELQKLRVSENDPLDLKVDIGPVDTSFQIAPILFIPFVENAFKYGIHLEQACFIHIQLSTSNNELLFTISNSKFNNVSINEHSGVGLSNVKRRLSLLYPNQHELRIVDGDDHYDLSLKIQLN
ncbi:sensor histidine kinase [Flagellimonas myxillae]|uniref:sensor histidine kinase n=1 Tax=Flagellimonas myxillae TaxID=2942214 RepID=UPI00201F224C|nr:sensor histidine kinase [Muricauda myxillae]MCL6266336.1 sensor histidine kinase [Muricauda myxillae]